MTNARLIYKNLWRNGTILSQSSEHPQFPVEFSQDDPKSLAWRTRYGTMSGIPSGNGQFVVSNSNKYIDFADTAETVAVGGDMESWASATDLNGWGETLSGTSTINREATTVKRGTYSCRFDIDASNNYALISQNITMTPSAPYRFSFWYKTAAGKTFSVGCFDGTFAQSLKTDGTWGAGSVYMVFPAATTWTKITISFSAHASYSNYILYVGAGSAMGSSAASSSIYLDDFFINPVRMATLTTGTYHAQTLVAEIKIRMDAAGGTYIVTYSETTGKFTITSTTIFDLLWLTGANTANNAAGLLGYDKTSDDIESNYYTSDYVRIHTSENIICDFGSAYQYNFVALLNHNLTATATITIKGADDAAISVNVLTDTITYNANNIFQFLGTARTKRYCQVYIEDIANPSMYIQIGVVVIGNYFEPNRSFGPYSEGEVDSTEMEYSPSMNMFTVQERPKLVNRELRFNGLDSTSIAQVRSLLSECGISKAIVLCTDYNNPNNYSYWVHLRETTPPEYSQYDYWSWDCPVEEVL